MDVYLNWAILLFEVVLAVVCCLGNALVIWAVWTCRALRQPALCFIAALAVADFLVGSVTIPLEGVVGFHFNTSFYGCLFMCCVFTLVEVASVLLLLAIAVDRYLRVLIPLLYKSTVTQKRSWIVVALCWFTAAVLSFIPMFGWNNQKTLNGTTSGNSIIKCSFFTVIPTSYLVNFIFLSCFLPPLAIMIGLYSYIFLTTRRQLRAQIANDSTINYHREHKLASSLALVLVLFIVCWLPLFFMVTIRFYCKNINVTSSVIDVGVLLSHCNSAINPIVYAFKIPKIKETFIKLWLRLSQKQSKPNDAIKNENSNKNNPEKNTAVTSSTVSESVV
ncbi:adenosine receptor A1-like [Astyanax mexicanus]|uniref:Adenosine A3 receptor a.1 n=1 Tax=Astyanax mexicanus TaxID=7994 RepID=A0A3B1JEK3_ASTMX|nr:adenosine receptor A1-like [Astyanax mexicanus]